MKKPFTAISMPLRLLALSVCFVLPAIGAAQDKPPEFVAARLSATVTMLKGQGGNVGISAGDDGVYIIDDQVQPVTQQLLVEIRKISDRPVRFIINTHHHADHVGGNEAIAGTGAVIVAHDNVYQRMSSRQFNNFLNETTEPWAAGALPVITFSDRITVHLNGEDVTVIHVANGHTDGDAIIHFPVSNVIHMGDIYFNGLYPFIDLDSGGSLQGILAGVELALTMTNKDTRIIPGHGPVSTPTELTAYRDFLLQAQANVQALIDQGKSLEEVIAARPTAQWDDALGQTWIKPAQMVTFIYNSLAGVHEFTRIKANTQE